MVDDLCILSDTPRKREAIYWQLAGRLQLTFVDLDGLHDANPQADLLLDINFTDGQRLLRLKEWLSGRSKTAKVIVVTDKASHREIMQAQALGATEIVHRPFAAKAFLERIAGAGEENDGETAAELTLRSPNVAHALDGLHDIFSSAQFGAPLNPVAINAAGEGIVSCIEERGVRSWIDTVRRHHSQTYQHCLLVTGMAVAFGQHLGFAAADRHRLAFAGMLHDIGKARIPIEILEKPAALSAEEIAVMRKHPELGLEVLENAPGLSPDMLDIVIHHHEYLDGSGYPHGLSGGEISDFVRIATICDVFGALLERRSYKAPLTTEAAYQILLDMGPKLDRDLVREFRFASALRMASNT
jgi:putative nucleotidyltransferase with HDIG domain